MQNYSYKEFENRIKEAGIEVIDLAPALFAMRRTGSEPYLKTDTHWTPDGMDLAARLVARRINPDTESPVAPIANEVTALGDIAAMLKLKKPEALFPPEKVILRNYRQSYAKDADILLLGDSFTNIYDAESMNWGAEAGFGRALMYHLGRPIDVIARNDTGAYATRQLLAQEQQSGTDRLAGKKTLIYQFAIRELADGDWKMLDLTLGKKPESKFLAITRSEVVEGEVLALSAVPRPGTAPYKDHVMSILLGRINGTAESQALIYIDSMRNNVLQPAATLKVGDPIRIELSPWAEHEVKYGSWTRSDLDDAEVMLQEPCWGRICK